MATRIDLQPSTTTQIIHTINLDTATTELALTDGDDTLTIHIGHDPANLPWARSLAFAALTACADLEPDGDGLTTARQAPA